MPKPKQTRRKPATGEPLAAVAPEGPPAFASEADERAFWETHDTVDYADWSRAERVRLPNLKPSTATISLRLPEGMLEELRVLANARDVPYQSLLKVFLAERLAAERQRKRHAG